VCARRTPQSPQLAQARPTGSDSDRDVVGLPRRSGENSFNGFKGATEFARRLSAESANDQKVWRSIRTVETLGADSSPQNASTAS